MSPMDSLLLLSPEARSRFLQSSARAIGCMYICIWSYIPYPSNCLICADAWCDQDQPLRFFNLYRASFCSVETGCVPGLAYKEGLPYIEIEDSNLMNLASTQVQRQFYLEAGIKKAVFLGSKNGEIEIGMASNMNNMNMQMINQLFSEDLITQQSQFRTDLSRPSSSSSSLRSLSVGSPEYSSLLPSTQSIPINPSHQNIQFPTPISEEEAMVRAMLNVISSNNPSSSSSPNVYISSSRAFKTYNSALAPKANIGSRQRLGGHNMIKMGISILRRMNLMRSEARVNQELRPPSGNPLQHMINERKRREKINESFNVLRMILPSGCKKDKASVLLSTREYLKSLKSQISELAEKNKTLESQLLASDHEIRLEAGDNSNERVQVQIIRSPESTSQMQGITLRIIIRVECDMHDLLLHVLECLKEMGVCMLSVNANTFSPQIGVFALLSFTLQIKASDWDEPSFKEAVTRTINSVVVVRAEAVPNDS